MIRKKRIQYNELNEEIYTSEGLSIGRIILLGILILIVGIIINFPFIESLTKFINKELSKNPACPVKIEKIQASYLPPQIRFQQVFLDGLCFGIPGNHLTLSSIKLTPDYPSISQLGLRFNIEIRESDSRILISPIISFNSIFFEIEKSKLNANLLRIYTNEYKSPIAGHLEVFGFIKTQMGKLSEANLTLNSSNFYFPSQKISGFDIPQINIGKFNLRTYTLGQDRMKVEFLDIGKPSTPIEIKLKGDIILNKDVFMFSMLNLKGFLRLSPDFLKTFSFLSILLPSEREGGKYEMTIQGPLNNPGTPQFQ